tara:strand:+ start:194 stop:355 length:162 start_codon:yes stop_codon:yes gene_type:complete
MSQLKADPTGASVGRRLGAKAQSEGRDCVRQSEQSEAWQQARVILYARLLFTR